MRQIRQLQINTDFPGMKVKAGDVIDVDCKGNVPFGIKNKFWRRRLKDAKRDKCVELLPTVAKNKPKEEG